MGTKQHISRDIGAIYRQDIKGDKIFGENKGGVEF